MGQYWKPVNLDKKEFIYPYQLGCGLKLGEMTGDYPGVAAALVILTAAMSERRGGGDFDMGSNYHGPERTEEHNMGAPVVEAYDVIAARTIGRWAGDRIAIVGDYAENSDLPAEFEASKIYELCVEQEYAEKHPNDYKDIPFEARYTDITADVCAVVEHECGGIFYGDGWRSWASFWDLAENIKRLQDLELRKGGGLTRQEEWERNLLREKYNAVASRYPEKLEEARKALENAA